MSGDRVREIRIQTARELEQRGFAEKAIEMYKRAGVPGEAVRLLVAGERYLDAGALMLEALGVGPDDAGTLDGRARGAAEKAARCFELGGDHETARRVRSALGAARDDAAPIARPSIAPDAVPRSAPVPSTAPPPAAVLAMPSASTAPAAAPSMAPPAKPAIAPPAPSMPPSPITSFAPPAREAAPVAPPRSQGSSDKWGRAAGWRGGAPGSGATDEVIRQLLEQGKKNAAARVAWDAGRLEDAARWFAESKLDYETGAVLYDLGRVESAMEALLRVSPDHKRHRAACTKLVDIAARTGRFDFELDRVLTQFAKAPPLEASELPTYLTLSELYARHGFHDGARRVLEQVLLFDASHEAARAALDALPPPVPPKRGTSIPPARLRRSAIPVGSRALPPIPTLDEFVAEARKRAPSRVAK